MIGHIRRRGQRSWEIKFDLGTDPATGKRLTRYHSFKGTTREAEAELIRLKAGAGRGEYVDPSKLTFSEFLDRWERDWATNNISPKTLEQFKELIKANVRPHIGNLQLQKLKPVHCAELYAKLLREGRKKRGGLAPRTVGRIHRILHRAFGHAVKWSLISINPCSAVEPPLVATTEIEVLTEDQVHNVLQKLRGRPMYMLAAVGLSAGLRRGELLALRWKDVDLDAPSIRIERSLEQTKAGLRFKEPKTKHGRRQLALPTSIAGELRSFRRQQHEQRLALGLGKDEPDALVFRHLSGEPMRPDNVSSEWRRLMRVLKLPLRAWRHTRQPTHPSEYGCTDDQPAPGVCGSPSITFYVYGHLFKGSDHRAAERIDAAFSRALME